MPSRVAAADASEHVGQVDLWIESVELGGFDQRVHRSSPPAAGIRAGEEMLLVRLSWVDRVRCLSPIPFSQISARNLDIGLVGQLLRGTAAESGLSQQAPV
jgi:hypothetical protein